MFRLIRKMRRYFSSDRIWREAMDSLAQWLDDQGEVAAAAKIRDEVLLTKGVIWGG